jgi:hypothetical protein
MSGEREVMESEESKDLLVNVVTIALPRFVGLA